MSHVNYCGGRPGSYYDNYGGEDDNNLYGGYADDDKYDKLRNEMLGYERAKSPTQTISLLTTVPQNITPVNIAGRHAPTRHSLRHSRMIVMNRMQAAPASNNNNNNDKSTPPFLRFHKLAKVLVALHIVFAVCICALAFWIYVFAPSIRQRDNPYWAGIPLLIAGMVGSFFLCCPRKDYKNRAKNAFAYAIKLLSIFLSTTAGAVCVLAALFAFAHLLALAMMSCAPSLELNDTCVCSATSTNGTAALLPPLPLLMRHYHYTDLQCAELTDFFVFLMIGSCGANVIGALVALWYVYLHWSSRYLYAYAKVHSKATQGPTSLIIQE